MSAKPKPIDLSSLLTPEQAAVRLGLTVDTVRQYARQPRGKLRPVRIFGRTLSPILFESAEIERFRAEKRAYERK